MSPVRGRRRIREILRQLKGRSCMDCGLKRPIAEMSFDHARGVKLFNLGGSLRGLTLGEVLAEVAKTDLVCRICHDAREAARGRLGRRTGEPG